MYAKFDQNIPHGSRVMNIKFSLTANGWKDGQTHIVIILRPNLSQSHITHKPRSQNVRNTRKQTYMTYKHRKMK